MSDSDHRQGYALLEERLGYRFHDLRLLETALTHKSYVNENPTSGRQDNERLEFLGDALLGLTIGHLLMERLKGPEGELSRARAAIVAEPGLAQVAEGIGLGEWLFLGRGEEQTGGRRKPSLLADTCEAVMAAIYLDAGFDAALEEVRRLFGPRLDEVQRSGGADAKTRLQERVQGRARLSPRYTVVGECGPDHDKTFEVAILLGEREVSRGVGKSKKEAEQRAAERALQILDAEEGRSPDGGTERGEEGSPAAG